MKCTLHRQTLLDASNRLIKWINPKPITPIFGTYLFHFTHNHLSITASEGNHIVTTTLDANCPKEDFRCCIPAIKFHRLIESFVDVEVNLSIKGSGENGSLQHLVIKCGKGKHDLPISDPLTFIVVKKPEALHVLKLDATTLLSMWENVTALVSDKDETVSQMSGINHIAHPLVPNQLTLCGGTGHRSAMASCPADVRGWKDINLHRDITARGKLLFNQSMSTITIAHNGQQCIITDGVSTIIGRGLEGRFPDVVKIAKSVVEANQNNIDFSCGEMSDAIKRLLFHKSETVETLSMNISEKEMFLRFVNRDMGTEGLEEIFITGNPSEAVLGMNILMLNDCIKALNSQSCSFNYSTPMKPFILTPIDTVQKDYSLSVLLAPSSF